MPSRKPLGLPPTVARTFVKDMRVYFAEGDKHKQDAIAARQLNAIKEHQGPRSAKPFAGRLEARGAQDQPRARMRSQNGMPTSRSAPRRRSRASGRRLSWYSDDEEAPSGGLFHFGKSKIEKFSANWQILTEYRKKPVGSL
jgi:hypothetical protein